MRSRKGIFVVLEGSDGSGKATQLNLLKARLKAIGYEVAEFDFPRYNNESSYFVRQYLAGEFGQATKISPYTSSLFYALDRYEAAKGIRNALKEGKIVLANRYVGSNMAHQGAKFEDPVEQRGFFIWEDNLEFELLGIPRPDISFFLRVPADVSLKLIKQRAARSGAKLDGHEIDKDFLKKSLETYDVLCRLFPKDYQPIECAKSDKLLSVAEINDLIWRKLKPKLPPERHHASHSVVVKLGAPSKTPAGPVEAPAGELGHIFKDASLLLRLLLQRNEKVTVSPAISSWQANDFRYYTPSGLPKNLSSQYRSTMELLAGKQQQIADKLTRFFADKPSGHRQALVEELMLPLTPLAALASFEMGVRKEAVRQLSENLLTSDSEEAQWTAQQLYLAARQKWPSDFKQPLETEGLESINSIISKLSYGELAKLGPNNEAISISEAHPKLEFDLLAESLYPYTELPREDIIRELANWTYEQKYKALKESAGRHGALKQVQYKIDILTDQVTIDKLLAAQPMAARQQPITARYGFETPPAIEEARADDLYADCFDESLKLFSVLQGAGLDQVTPYTTLLGHKHRWQLSTDAAALKNLFDESPEPLRSLLASLSEQLSEAHPLLWEILLSTTNEPSKPKNKIKPAHRRPAKRRGNSRKKT